MCVSARSNKLQNYKTTLQVAASGNQALKLKYERLFNHLCIDHCNFNRLLTVDQF